jgi:hypothetical protein
MESAAIIKEGFEEIYKKGVKILKYVVDADANTYKILKLSLPYCDKITKIDCRNEIIYVVTLLFLLSSGNKLTNLVR